MGPAADTLFLTREHIPIWVRGFFPSHAVIMHIFDEVVFSDTGGMSACCGMELSSLVFPFTLLFLISLFRNEDPTFGICLA